MAVSRDNGSVYIAFRNPAYFTLWFSLSIVVHTVIAVVLALYPGSPQKPLYIQTYEIDLFPRPAVVKTEEVPKKEEVQPSPPPEKPKIEKNKQKSRMVTVRKSIAIPKTVKDEVNPEEAISQLREKFAPEEAVNRIRRKVKDKETVLSGESKKDSETASSSEVKIAAMAPARVYHYEELDAELRAYFEKVSQMIREAWTLPEILRNKGYRTILSIHVQRDGMIESLWIEEGSGNKYYDESTLRAINKVTPLPPLPKVWSEETIDLGLRF